MKRTLLYYLNQNHDSLLPDDAQVLNIKDSEWYNAIKPFFNELIWEYYSDRVVFIDSRFKYDDTDETIISNIKRSFAILLKTKNYEYEKLYETLLFEYNPIWNVDGVTGTIHEYESSGSDKHKKTGNDTLKHTGYDNIEHRGNNKDEHRGFDLLDKSGTDTVNHTGTITDDVDTVTDSYNYNTTYDSVATSPVTEFLAEHQKDMATGKSNKRTNANADATTYGSLDRNVFDSDMTTKFNSNDKTNYNSNDKTEYNSEDNITRSDYRKDLDLSIRQGNIGVTMTQQMIDAERKVAMFDFYKKVVHDCVNTCTYSID